MALPTQDLRRTLLALLGASPFTLLTTPAAGGERSTPVLGAGTNGQTVARAFDGWRAGTSNFFDLLAPGASWTIVGNSAVSRRYASRREFLDLVIEPFNARLSRRLLPTVRTVYAAGDTVVALWDGEAVARDGKPYRNTYAWFMRFRGESIVDVVAFFDSIAFNDLWQRVSPQP